MQAPEQARPEQVPAWWPEVLPVQPVLGQARLVPSHQEPEPVCQPAAWLAALPVRPVLSHREQEQPAALSAQRVPERAQWSRAEVWLRQ